MDEIIEKLLQVKNEKDNKIIPENIKEGVTIFGITGSCNNNSKKLPYLFNDVRSYFKISDMEQDDTITDGTVGIICNEFEVKNVQIPEGLDENDIPLDEYSLLGTDKKYYPYLPYHIQFDKEVLDRPGYEDDEANNYIINFYATSGQVSINLSRERLTISYGMDNMMNQRQAIYLTDDHINYYRKIYDPENEDWTIEKFIDDSDTTDYVCFTNPFTLEYKNSLSDLSNIDNDEGVTDTSFFWTIVKDILPLNNAIYRCVKQMEKDDVGEILSLNEIERIF